MPSNLIRPPIRTALLNNSDGTPMNQNAPANGSSGSSPAGLITTAKSWYNYWGDCGSQINANTDKLNKLLTYGTHAARPDPATMPDGALYVEEDRGQVLYQNLGGVWYYVAGTFWGTLSPDQRPTDLGASDAGFEFRSVDTNPDLAPRTFVWSQSEWIETTLVEYGTHANRPAPDEKTPPRTLYVEEDRGNVIYQQQAGKWMFLAGTMWGTLSPDQRPTDLGVNDAGFTFRGTDQQREFIWSQVAWVETTPVTGAANLTHPNVVTRVGATAGQIVEGGITDQSAAGSNSLFINSSGVVGVGTTNTSGGCTISGGSGTDRMLNFRGDPGTFGVPGSNGIVLQPVNGSQSATTAMMIFCGPLYLNGGNVGIGMSSAPIYTLQLASDSAGKPSSSTWAVVSDMRVKQNVEPVQDDSLAILSKLDWIRYKYNGQASTPRDLKAIGLHAQALQEHLPEAVRTTKAKLNDSDAEETDVLAIDYHHILVHSARAIQQLDAEVKRLKAMLEKQP